MSSGFRDDPTQLKPFHYETPAGSAPKKLVWLARTDHLFAIAQTVTHGGETNLHSHASLDGFWFVLKGRARFYSDKETVAAELGPHDGVLVPRGVKYWFESCGAEPLEILQIECSDKAFGDLKQIQSDRTNYESEAAIVKSSQITEAKPL